MVPLISDRKYQLLATKFLYVLINMAIGKVAVRDSLVSRGLDEILGKFFTSNICESLFEKVC